MKNLNITLGDHLHRRVEAAAAALGITIGAFQERAARELRAKLQSGTLLSERGI